MKKVLFLAAAALMSASAFADSYTITFKDSGTEADLSSQLKPTDPLGSFIASDTTLISSFGTPDGAGTKVYLAKAGWGLKFGSSKAAGNLVLKLSAKAVVKADSIRVNASMYSDKDSDVVATLNGNALPLTVKEFKDYVVRFDEPQSIDSLYLTSTGKRFYAKEVEVYYTPDAEPTFDAALAHSPRYCAGVPFEYVLGPDLIGSFTKTNAETGEVATKPGIADKYQWVEYVNPTSTLDNGKGEVQQSNRWTNWNPAYADFNYGEGANWIQIKGNNGSVNSPVVSSAWGKYITFYVKDATKVTILGIGSASGSADDGNCLKVVATASDNSDIQEVSSTPGKIYGKGSASDTVSVVLDPTKAYMITVKGDDTVNKDIMIGGLQIFGTSEVPGTANKTTNATYAYWDVVTGPDMIVKGGTKVKTNAETGEVQDKWGVDDNLTWIEYVNPTSTLDDGTAEVQTSNRWTDLNPRTGEKGAWLQVAGKDGDVNAPVLSPSWGKYMKFQIAGTKKFTVYGAGSASGSADDGNCLKVTAYPYNSNDSIVATSTPGGIYGKGSASDLVSVELDETESYEIKVEAAVKDIQVLGINLLDAAGEANQAAGKGTLNMAIEKAQKNEEGSYQVNLESDGTYTLNGEAATDLKPTAIVGNGATIVTDSLGQITSKSTLVVVNAKFNCANSTVAPIALAKKASMTAADSLAVYTEITVGYDTVIAKIDTTYAEDGTISKIDTTYAYNPVKGMKYEGANQKVFEAMGIGLFYCEFKQLGTSLIAGNDAPWALDSLEIEGVKAEFNYTSGDPIINFYGGPNSIKSIRIAQSTLYNDSVNTSMYFLRYSNASNAKPVKVWGTDATAEWVMYNNTFVNLPSNQAFANNYVSDKSVNVDWQKNVFANTYRLQKAVGNCTHDSFTAEDNVISGVTNTVDATDASKYATVDTLMNVTAQNFFPCPYSYATLIGAGVTEYLSEFIYLPKTSINLMKDFIWNEETQNYENICQTSLVFANADSVRFASDKILELYAWSYNEETGEDIYTYVKDITLDQAQLVDSAYVCDWYALELEPGDYVVSIPAGTCTLYNAADNHQVGLPNEYAISDIFNIESPVGIEKVNEESNNAVLYNVAGQRVNSAKGLVIKNGKVQMMK